MRKIIWLFAVIIVFQNAKAQDTIVKTENKLGVNDFIMLVTESV